MRRPCGLTRSSSTGEEALIPASLRTLCPIPDYCETTGAKFGHPFAVSGSRSMISSLQYSTQPGLNSQRIRLDLGPVFFKSAVSYPGKPQVDLIAEQPAPKVRHVQADFAIVI